MCELVKMWVGRLNFIKYFVKLFYFIYGKIGTNRIKSNKKDFKIDNAEIIKQKINRNKFGFPTYSESNKSNKN